MHLIVSSIAAIITACTFHRKLANVQRTLEGKGGTMQRPFIQIEVCITSNKEEFEVLFNHR